MIKETMYEMAIEKIARSVKDKMENLARLFAQEEELLERSRKIREASELFNTQHVESMAKPSHIKETIAAAKESARGQEWYEKIKINEAIEELGIKIYSTIKEELPELVALGPKGYLASKIGKYVLGDASMHGINKNTNTNDPLHNSPEAEMIKNLREKQALQEEPAPQEQSYKNNFANNSNDFGEKEEDEPTLRKQMKM